MEHLLTTYIRTKSLCGRSRFDDGTVMLTKNELLKLRHPLGLRIDEISDKLIELKCKGEIKGYGNNFKATKKDGFTKPELLEITGEKRPRGRKTSIEVTQSVKGRSIIALYTAIPLKLNVSRHLPLQTCTVEWTTTDKGDYESQKMSMKDIIAGVDEAGRGPLAGPGVAAAVILNADHHIDGLTDSKKLSEHQRMRLEKEIRKHELTYAIAEASVEEIDRFNILRASMLAMQRAVLALDVRPFKVKVDGNQAPDLPGVNVETIVRGDLSEACISAASILAKQYRDRKMVELDREYQLARHKGYPTKLHRRLL
ncbi:Ribonuclease HII [Seminavis robusta]|uniref:Ribonuclease n=1 Tax=Seminavis robusta TaxID=568900 RepID=A0A9N8EZZ3_9STRA|nr:Ribonuclease HII [Seminavis robusta]|eukprot:Sro2701_g335070.1 Ribonuclease HII (312) ;mRNA; f:6396-7507